MRSMVLLTVAFTTLAAGCAGRDITASGADSTDSTALASRTRVASVTVTPNPDTIVVGGTVQLTATMRSSSGAVISGRSITWRVSDTTRATVSGTGLVTGRAAGSVSVSATVSNVTGSATVVVNAAPATPVASVAVTPSSLALSAGQGGQLTATMKDANGNVLSGRAVSWSTANPSIATVSATGYVTAVGAGSTSIVATSEGKTGSASVSVTAPAPAPVASVTVSPASLALAVGQGGQLTATTKDANGNVLTGRSVTWTSSNTAVATVSGSGYVTASGAGNASITATSEGKTGSSAISVGVGSTTVAVDTIFYDGFESGNLSLWQDEGSPAQHAVVSTAGNVYSGTKSLQVTYPSGGDAGWLTRFFMPGYDSVFVRVRLKLDANWTGGTKLMYFGGSRIDNQWSAMGKAGVCPNGTDFFDAYLYGEVSPQMATHFYTYYYGMYKSPDGMCWGNDGPQNNVSSVYSPDGFQITPGAWHTVEFWVKANAIGQSNGAQQFWVDGVLRGSWAGITFRTTTDLRLNSFTLSVNTPYTTSTTRQLWFDEVLVTKQKLEP